MREVLICSEELSASLLWHLVLSLHVAWCSLCDVFVLLFVQCLSSSGPSAP